MTHPLDKLSAVVDGALDHDSRDRVLSHLVGCDSCRSEVDAQRRLKARMATQDVPEPSLDLMQRLMGVSSFSTEPREEVRPVLTPAVSLFPQRSAFPAGRTGGNRPGATRSSRSRRRAGVLGAAGSAAAVASLLGTAFVVGDPSRSEQPPTLQPPVASFSSDHASTSGGAPFADPVGLMSTYSPTGYAGLNQTLGSTVRPVALTGR